MSERKERCETCRFWFFVSDEESCIGPSEVMVTAEQYKSRCDEEGYVMAGECHCRAPAAAPDMVTADRELWPDRALAMWPITLPLDWCGEWQPIPKERAE